MCVLFVDFWFWNGQRWDFVGPRPHRVLSVSYSNDAVNPLYRKFYIEAGRYDPGWRITVEPVPRRLRHTVQSMLLTEALPRVKRWLIDNRNVDGRSGGHNLIFLFDELANKLKIEENSSSEWNTARVETDHQD